MATLHRSYNGLLAQELGSGQQTSQHRYLPVFKQKETIVKFDAMGTHLTSFNPNETWHRH